MILEMDVGNSRVKWRLRTQDDASTGEALRPQQTKVCSHEAVIEQHADLLAQLAEVKQIQVSSVVGSMDQPIAALASQLQVPVLQARTTAKCAGVTNSYAEPARMGVDRWLAMLAGFNQYAGSSESKYSLCVVDCGTSLTVDFVASDGTHEGGLILPGRSLLLGSLSRNTEKVLFDPASDQGELALGKSTDQAVFNGAEHMLLGVIQQAIASAPTASERLYLLTGGDGPRLLEGFQRRLKLEASVVPDLVLDGLQHALP